MTTEPNLVQIIRRKNRRRRKNDRLYRRKMMARKQRKIRNKMRECGVSEESVRLDKFRSPEKPFSTNTRKSWKRSANRKVRRIMEVSSGGEYKKYQNISWMLL